MSYHLFLKKILKIKYNYIILNSTSAFSRSKDGVSVNKVDWNISGLCRQAAASLWIRLADPSWKYVQLREVGHGVFREFHTADENPLEYLSKKDFSHFLC